MPILIRHQGKNAGMAHPFDSAIVTEHEVLISWVSYAEFHRDIGCYTEQYPSR